MTVSLSCRHRSVIGTASVQAAKATLLTLLGASPSMYDIYFGTNASTMLNNLAQWYARTNQIQNGDEILIQTENHLANVTPWIDIANLVGATILWWDASSSIHLADVVTPKTRIVAISHASNMIGHSYNYQNLRRIVDEATKGYGHIVVDGVTYVPHRYADIDKHQFDWYVISCHKMFGPHLGVLCGRRQIESVSSSNPDTAVPCLDDRSETNTSIRTLKCFYGLQCGTVNYEACEGIRGLGLYFMNLRAFDGRNDTTNHTQLNETMVLDTYRRIESTETALVQFLLNGLQRSTKIRIVGESTTLPTTALSSRLPIVSFVHATIPSSRLVEKCNEGGVICRSGTFLSTARLQQLHAMYDPIEGVVRFSMAHYNTCNEVKYTLSLLESIPDWL